MKIFKEFYGLELINGIITKQYVYGKPYNNLYKFKYSQLKSVKKIEEMKQLDYGIYLINHDDDSGLMYVGETLSGLNRFNSHDYIERKSKENDEDLDFTIYFFSLESSAKNKSILHYLESKVIKLIASEDTNKTKGYSNQLTDANKFLAEEILDEFKSLLKLNDVYFSDNKLNKIITNEPEFFIKMKGADAIIYRSGNNFVLKKGSTVRAKERKLDESNFKGNHSLLKYYKNWIEFVDENNQLTKDLTRKSPSLLVAFAIGGQTANGWTVPKNKNGETMDQYYRTNTQ